MDESKTRSGIGLKGIYTPDDLGKFNYDEKLGMPGSYPFTRGPYKTMYTGRTWTLRSQIGYGTPQLTNERIRFMTKQGQTGFTMTIDLPTSYGFDSDDPFVRGEVGTTGVPISTLEDMETVFDDVAIGDMRVSLSIRPPVSAVTLGMYVAMANKRGIDLKTLSGTQQDDPFFQMSGGPMQTNIQFFPLDQIMRLCVDVAEYCARYLPKLNWMPANGYNIRETGVSAIHEAAFAMSCALQVSEKLIERGLDPDQFLSRLTFFHSSSIDFFEEIAKFRAMRRLWARLCKERLGAKEDRSCLFRTSCQTGGSTLATQQPLVNIVRATVESMAGVLGGVQSLQASSYDEGLSLPTEKSATISLRTQQVILDETGISKVIDPLAGSYLVEALTDELEGKMEEMIEKIDSFGGLIEAIKAGWIEDEINICRTERLRRINNGEEVLVGVNRYMEESDDPIEVFYPDEEGWEKTRCEYLAGFREKRDNGKVSKSLDKVKEDILTEANMIHSIKDAVETGATMGEVHNAMREAIGFEIE
ncbi:MAG: acyl-CoA mutase large subunit family protein [Deltaproteobacteria bacterium]|nr:acyl-CoA mutase large subunit family protein [Deltaproteobacteria bacterium]